MSLSKRKFYLLIAVVSILYALSIFDFSFILGHGVYWQEPFGDRITNLIGASYFAHDSWRWPLFFVPSLAFPEGTNIIYTDSLPLLALVAKIIYKVTGTWFNYFGLWLFACFPLIGLFTALAIKEGGCKDAIAIAGGILLALASPELLIRFGHAALMGQFLIVWSFYLYLKFQRIPSLKNFTIQFAIITSLCILLQVYILLMVLPFFMAALLQAVLNKRIQWNVALFSFVILMSSIILIAFVSGMIGQGSPSATADGFGYYSMNVLSPFLPPREHLPNFISRYIHWSGNAYSWDATGGQYEGYNYLGAGILILLLMQITALKSLAKPIFKQHLFLFLALLTLCLLALSNRIFFGDWLILDISIPKKLFSYFRTGGRLFWPIYYVLVVALVLVTFKRFSPILAKTIIVIAVIAQLADTQLLRHNMTEALNRGFPQVLSQQIWQPILAANQFIVQYPSFQCGGWAGDWPENNSNMELLLLAAKQNKPTNSAYLARTSRNCMNEKIEAAATQIQPGGLYIFAKNFSMREIKVSGQLQNWCREFKFGFVCSRQFATQPELTAYPEFQVPAHNTAIPTYHAGEVLRFTTDGNGENFLGHGWYGAESWGTWTKGKESEIVLNLPKSQSNQYVMTIYARGFVHSNHPEKLVDIYVNGKKLASWQYHIGAEVVRYSAKIPQELLQADGILKIKLISDVAETPKQAGLSDDQKEISLGLIELSITPVDATNEHV